MLLLLVWDGWGDDRCGSLRDSWGSSSSRGSSSSGYYDDCDRCEDLWGCGGVLW